MTKKIVFAILTFALAVAFAGSTHNVTLFQPSVVGGTELKPGEYKLVVESDKVVISQGKQKVEAAIKAETADSKFSSTSVRYATADGKNKVQEIRLGGTNTKLVFNN